MFPFHLLEDPALKKRVRAVGAKDYLFQQGDLGNSMFIIVEGRISLFQTTLNTTRLVDTAGKGEMLGEKTVVLNQPYKRTLSAQAATDVIVLELDPLAIKAVAQRIPDFSVQILRHVIRRLDKCNELVGVLQLRDDTERMLQYLLFWARHTGKKAIQGIECSLKVEDISNIVNVRKELVDEALRVLALSRIIERKGDLILIPDDSAVSGFLPALKMRMAA